MRKIRQLGLLLLILLLQAACSDSKPTLPVIDNTAGTKQENISYRSISSKVFESLKVSDTLSDSSVQLASPLSLQPQAGQEILSNGGFESGLTA